MNDASLEELKNTKIVKSSDESIKQYLKEKKNLIEDLASYYKLWDFKFKDMPLLQRPMLVVNNIPNKLHKTFSNIKVEQGSHNNAMDQESIGSYVSDLKGIFNQYNDGKKLTVRITFDKYDNGNMATRYIIGGFGIDKEAWGIIDFKIELINEDEEVIINSFRIFETEMGGFLGGINTLKSDTINVLTDYIKANYLKD